MHIRIGALRAAALSLLVVTLTGCVDRTVSGDTTTYSFALWVIATVALVGLAAAPLGWVFRRASKRWLVIGLIATPVVLLFLWPSLLLDKVRIDSNHFEGRYGLWFKPTTFDVRYADLDHIDLVTYEERGRRGRKNTKQRLECVSKSGHTTKVALGDLLKHSRDEVLIRATAAGVPIRDVDTRGQ
jgi:hypothetical protein